MSKASKTKNQVSQETVHYRSAIWIVPLVVVCIGAVLVYRVGLVEQQDLAEKKARYAAADAEAAEKAKSTTTAPSGDEVKPTEEGRTDVERPAKPDSSTSGHRINDPTPPGPPPAEGMVWIPGGTFWMGTDDSMFPDAQPVHRVSVDGFWMDRTEVTNAQFQEFVDSTGYKTVAERPINPADYPGVSPENLDPGSIVFNPPDHKNPTGQPDAMVGLEGGSQLAASPRARIQHRRPDGPPSGPRFV